jgi:predicted acylesterase/phospholipase RssA
VRMVRGDEVRWEHLAATCAIPLSFPPVRIGDRWFVDGGLRGALPMWVAEEMGADRAIGLHCLTIQPFPILRAIVRPRRTGPSFDTKVIEPCPKLGSLRDSVVWNASNVERWLEQGAKDAMRALSSVRM